MAKQVQQQGKLVFDEESLWHRLPEETQRSCRSLLSRLLREIVLEEIKLRRTGDE
jgi:hypothetical protein